MAPIKFRKEIEAGVTFDYRDVLRGNGYLTFYGGDAIDNASAVKYVLLPAVFSSENKLTNVPHNATTVLTFEIKIGKTMRLFGNAILNFLIQTSNNSGANTIIATLKKYNGTTETTIKEIGHEVITTGITGTDNNFKRCCFSDEISSTILKKGEILRLVISITSGDDPNAHGTWLYHDPIQRLSVLTAAAAPFAAYSDSSDLTLNIPFKIEE